MENQFNQDLEVIGKLVNEESASLWMDRFFFNTLKNPRMSLFIQGIQNKDVSQIRKQLENYKNEMVQGFQQQQKRKRDEEKKREIQHQEQRRMIPSRETLSLMKVKDLQDLLRRAQLSPVGKKADLIQRLVDY